MTSGQRANLRAHATKINSIFQIGKGGISDNFLADLCKGLDEHELIKITVLRNSEATAKDIIRDLAIEVGAEPVTAIGNKIVLYKRSTKDGIKHIEFWFGYFRKGLIWKIKLY